ncbi:MAG: 3-isopropylmalate dehydrogenase [Spirochaetia bacterium]
MENANMKEIAVLPGDGIGPEIMEQAEKIIGTVNEYSDLKLKPVHADVGGAAIDRHGKALPEETVEICKNSEAILFGAVGGPKWESLPPAEQPERAALLPLRKIFNLFANLRPATIFPELAEISPIKTSILKNGMDILVVRELTGGIYFGDPKGKEPDKAFDTLIYSSEEIERIAHVAFKAAQKRRKIVTSIDKANVLSSMVFWREIVIKVAAAYPDVELRHMYVDNAAMQLVKNPGQFDVMLCGNMFGDILSDEAAAIAGSLGMLPSASLSEGTFGLYEPAGGSAPDIAGQKKANPLAQIMSLAMMYRYTFHRNDIYQAIVNAIGKTISEGYRTSDIYNLGNKQVNTDEMGNLICENVKTDLHKA